MFAKYLNLLCIFEFCFLYKVFQQVNCTYSYFERAIDFPIDKKSFKKQVSLFKQIKTTYFKKGYKSCPFLNTV